MRRQRRQPRQNPYRAYRGKSRWGRILSWTAGALAVLLLLLAAGAWAMFRQEWAIAGTIRRLDAPRPVYFMEIEGDYHFDAFLQQGGASSDQEVSAFLTEKISKGFYTASTTLSGTGCSVLSAQSGDGSLLWGRNFDWTGSVPIILRHVPEDGYASLSTCDFQNITGSADVLPEGVVNRMLAIAALYVPMDGVNEAGLCVADLEVNEGGMPDPDTEKPDLTVTTAIRLLLNRAATVEEARELSMLVIVPAFVSTELKIAFEIGFLLYIPFMLIDVIVSSTLMSMGMIMLPPSMISPPFKILLFILLDGWHLLFSSLVRGINW